MALILLSNLDHTIFGENYEAHKNKHFGKQSQR
jgi:hypothetical protein